MGKRYQKKYSGIIFDEEEILRQTIIVDSDNKTFRFESKQTFWRAVELLENHGKKFYIAET